jgi:LacI family transcriptional regulator
MLAGALTRFPLVGVDHPMPRPPHVALLIETSRAYGRSILQGVVRYLHGHGPWSVYIQAHGLESPPPLWLKNWRGDGILARINDRAMARAVRQTGLPAVDLRFTVPKLGLPAVGIDNRAVVRLAYQHLSDCGFRYVAFCGLPRGQSVWMDLRCDLFRDMARADGRPCHVFESPMRKAAVPWEEEQEAIATWVSQLPRPVGVMACNDDRGQQVLDACRRVNALVPEEVAVIGVDNDEILCSLSNPPLTSVDINTIQVGYEAAALLDRMMSGARAPSEPNLLSPRGVIPRESTDVLATDDRELAAAIRFIRDHACRGLRVKELVRKTGMTRRSLERRMDKLLGRSPKDEITRVQIERAKRLLTETDLTAAEIAEKCGYSQPKYFSQVFHARVGLPPGAYRRIAPPRD